MPARKRAAEAAGGAAETEPVTKRRSSRQAAAAVAATAKATMSSKETAKPEPRAGKKSSKAGSSQKATAKRAADTTPEQPRAQRSSDAPTANGPRGVSEDPDVDSLPAVNPDAPRHDGEWYWLMKAEPETRFENGVDVRFSIDDLRAKTKPEGWDGIRAYAGVERWMPARNHMRSMNAGDKAFFYHSNCKEPGIAGTMEIVKEFSEDKSARRPGTPYYDPSSTRANPRWSLVHVAFRNKFAVPITLRELRELGAPGGPLADMQMLKQTRLSVSRVSAAEWAALCRLADDKAAAAGLRHEE
ncbi:Thymocyte nuclear protein 1 [Tolypocladium paradoxum]|uniref:Thymocyte nuclear protein 1 n=1 Tax=Tolypocladium paradoxum TaxID=94208 RepID=A0A2S4KSW6_9HYPO|nr:Thymocyte nuclear protein 1 [Tolypocladium paradoxum]